MQIFVPGIEPDRLQRRLIFLEDRAKAHLSALEGAADVAGEKAMLSRACAATLLRDAACVALLLGRMGNARRSLLEAGRHFLTLGMPSGAALVALADIGQATKHLSAYQDVMQGTRQQWGPAEAREREDLRRPLSERARGEPRQLLGIMQADWLMAESGQPPKTFADSEAMRITLNRAGGYAAGATGLSIDSYMRLADAFVRQQEVNLYEHTWIDRSLSTFYAARSEKLVTAQKDAFHWRMLPRPAELVDLDATILMVLALGANLSSEMLGSAYERDNPILEAPLHIAEALRDTYSHDHSL
ncbi:MAG: hypothetical protein V7704_08455 [Aurantimonas endophytica]|uniref:hypothetical protein n=1 Tax=Aurantimonas endophytica TaxID=1522175 RepID=UPI0030033468